MGSPLQPIYLFADSQLLFWSDKEKLFLESILERAGHTTFRAAYVGASNGDDPQFYSIFEAAMESVDIPDRRMILSSFSSEDDSFIRESNIILLAGGDVERGWNAFTRVGLNELIVKRYYEGALLIGISAGAVQLGLFGLIEGEAPRSKLIDTFKLVPFVISAHEENRDWKSLKETIQLLDGDARGIGIPTGGGLVCYPDQSIAPIRRPLYEFSSRGGAIDSRLLAPDWKE
jgi:peptidase E